MSIELGFLATMASDFNTRLLNRSPAPPASISPSAVAPARDHGEKLPIGHGWGRATRRGISTVVGSRTKTIGLAMANPAGYGAARPREA